MRQQSKLNGLQVALTLSPWVRDLLVDPISKGPFVREDSDGFLAACGLRYAFRQGVPDFRVQLGAGASEWLEGQKAFAEWFARYLDRGEASEGFYLAEQQLDRKVYEALPLEGSVLDIGGQLGHIRKYMAADQKYCSVDPFVGAHLLVSNRKNLFANYPLSRPLNFLGGFAEFLPIKEKSFDTVSMRSCIDHFYNPELALLEAFRVIRSGGRLIVGLKIEGHTLQSSLIEIAKGVVGTVIPRYRDHHMWHPSYKGLMELCNCCGFDFEKEYWQRSDVLYASFIRRDNHLVTMQSDRARDK